MVGSKDGRIRSQSLVESLLGRIENVLGVIESLGLHQILGEGSLDDNYGL